MLSFGLSHATCHFCLPERRELSERGRGLRGDRGGRTAPLGGWSGSGGGLFPSFADARPLFPSKPFSQSKC